MIEMVKYYVTRIADSGGFREQMMSFLGLDVVAHFSMMYQARISSRNQRCPWKTLF
jgi:hypothetical protein